MKELKYIKIFEAHEYDNLIFSMSEEDISDLMLPLTDKGFKLTIRPIFVNDRYDELSDYASNISLRTNLLKNRAMGAYIINLRKNREETSNNRRKFSLNPDDGRIIRFVSKEISQISKRVEYVEWEFDKDSYGNVVIDMILVCPKKQSKRKKRKIIFKKEYDDSIDRCKTQYLSSILQRIKVQLTKVMKDGIVDQSLWTIQSQKYLKHGKIYLFFKNVSKGVITTNLRRVLQLSNLTISFGKNIIPVSVSLLDIYDFTNKNNMDIPYDGVTHVIEIEFDYDKFERICKEKVKSEFIYRNIQ